MKVVRLSALHTGRPYRSGNISGTHFCYRLSRPQSHSAAGRIMSMKGSNDTIENRTRDLLACSAVPQPTADSTMCFPVHLYEQSLPFLASFICLSRLFFNLILKISTVLVNCIWSIYTETNLFKNCPILYPWPLSLTQMLSSHARHLVTSKLKVSVTMNRTWCAQLTAVTKT